MSNGKGNEENGKSVSVVPSPASGSAEAFLGKGTKVVGSISFSGPVVLEGTIEGEVTAKETLTIGEGAVINAKVQGAEVIVKGSVNGDIFASKRLSIRRPARVTGNIASPTISIEDGVHFEGRCSMSATATTHETPRGEGRGGLQSVGGNDKTDKNDKVVGFAAA